MPKPNLKHAPNLSIQPLLLLLLLISISPKPAQAVSYAQLRTLISLSSSLMRRVANLRASRGDVEGSERARRIADKIDGGVLGFWRSAWKMSWDYLRNYHYHYDDEVARSEFVRSVEDANELLRVLSELTRLESDRDWAAWVVRSYGRVLGIGNSLTRRLLRVFGKSGAWREVVMVLQKEVEGDLLMDCIEVGIGDLKGLLQIIKELGLQYSGWNHHGDRSDL